MYNNEKYIVPTELKMGCTHFFYKHIIPTGLKNMLEITKHLNLTLIVCQKSQTIIYILKKETTMKHHMTIGIILSLLILLTIGCQGLQNQMKAEPDDTPVSVSVDDVDPTDITYTGEVFIGDAGDRFGTDEFVVNSATITDDTLTVNVSYGGGCEAHQFTLVVSDSFLESSPVQLHVSLAHNANGDACEAYLTEKYQFDLTPIKNMYQEAYRQEAGTIILRLKNAPDTDLVYEFTM